MVVKVSLLSGAVASDGVLSIQTNGTTEAISISTGQVATFVNGAVIQGLTIGRGAGAVTSNTAVGASALAVNTSGVSNVSMGWVSMPNNTTGSYNVGIGAAISGVSNGALGSNTTGSNNVAIGLAALVNNTTASNNTAVGYQAGYSNTTGLQNTFIGYTSGFSHTTGTTNTFIGQGSGYFVTTGTKSTIIGGYNGNQGGLDIRTASNYIVLSDGDGNPRIWTDNDGNTSFTGGVITCLGGYTNTTASAANVNINSNGTYFRSTSALKYKQDVRDLEEMDISLLRAVRYKSKCEGDDQTKDHLGLIADEAAEAGFEELVTRGDTGEVEGFQYERLTVVLLKKLQVLESEFKAYKEAHP
jgi:hypothetical protein